MDTPASSTILDERLKKEFNKITISKFKKTDVMKSTFKAITEGKIEEACYWTVELHCSGQLDQWWKQIIIYHSEYINIKSPYLSQWLWKSWDKYKQLEEKFDKKFHYEGRNNQQIRNLISDVIVLLLLSKKNPVFTKKALPPVSPLDFSKERLGEIVKAKNTNMICNILSENDPKEIQLGLNEFTIHLNNPNSTFNDTVYWFLWLLLYETECKVHNLPIICHGAKVRGVNEKFVNDWIWYLWQIILKEVEYRNMRPLSYQILALYKLYKENYSTATKKSKTAHIYHTILLLKGKVNWQTPIIEEYHIRLQVCGNINQLYLAIAKASGTHVHKNNISMLNDMRERCKRKKTKHKKKVEELEKQQRKLEERTAYLRVLKIPYQKGDDGDKDKPKENADPKKLSDYIVLEDVSEYKIV